MTQPAPPVWMDAFGGAVLQCCCHTCPNCNDCGDYTVGVAPPAGWSAPNLGGTLVNDYTGCHWTVVIAEPPPMNDLFVQLTCEHGFWILYANGIFHNDTTGLYDGFECKAFVAADGTNCLPAGAYVLPSTGGPVGPVTVTLS